MDLPQGAQTLLGNTWDLTQGLHGFQPPARGCVSMGSFFACIIFHLL